MLNCTSLNSWRSRRSGWRLLWRWFGRAGSAAALGVGVAHAAPGNTSLLVCGQPGCNEGLSTGIAFVDCGPAPLVAWSVLGRWMWGPLRCVGPVELAVQVLAIPGTPPLPLIVQIRSDAVAATCHSLPGSTVLQTFGLNSCDPDSLWVTTTVDLPRFVATGSDYWVQVEGFAQFDTEGIDLLESPYFSCIRISPTAPVAAANWGSIKSLYR